MLGLITDRTQRNVHYRKELASKGWAGMTVEERAVWMGDPLAATGVNLLPPGPHYSSSVNLKYKNREIVATALTGGTYLYSVSIIGEAVNYQNKVFTLSTEGIESVGGGSAQLAVYWHDDSGFEYAGASLLQNGSVMFNTGDFPNTASRKYLALYVYVTTFETVETGAYVRFKGVMLENGDTKHSYVPYVEILPTMATKGAYNYSDLNRVERAVTEISEHKGLGLITKTDWTMWDVPTASDMTRYLSNIEAIRKTLTVTTGVPPTPLTMNNLTYSDANSIEMIILAVAESANL
jgi:hypothetical protein